ncbi:MAG TPA: hypothetical protein P5555_10725 [Candidatus Paceibacterota bacterium]|nr:hypothetical protein [Verrucomicrobiota bacterium]HRZ45651.1 hypothetical protein [Candidatus Paceibacterota bacterium]HRZ91835.1 hypothetical protein [Candidatus Paceibacterota bacterium]
MNSMPGHLEALRDDSLRRAPSAEEIRRLESWLAGHPEQRAQWESDLQVGQWLRELPDPPVSPGFVPKIMAALDRPSAAGSRRLDLLSFWRLWLPPLRWAAASAAAAILLASAAFIGYRHHQSQTRVEIARSVAQISDFPLSLDLLSDFDVIRRLDPAAVPVDEELLAALQ